VRNLSPELLTSEFHSACNSAAPSTAAITPVVTALPFERHKSFMNSLGESRARGQRPRDGPSVAAPVFVRPRSDRGFVMMCAIGGIHREMKGQESTHCLRPTGRSRPQAEVPLRPTKGRPRPLRSFAMWRKTCTTPAIR
jgi:hypothetical protein